MAETQYILFEKMIDVFGPISNATVLTCYLVFSGLCGGLLIVILWHWPSPSSFCIPILSSSETLGPLVTPTHTSNTVYTTHLQSSPAIKT